MHDTDSSLDAEKRRLRKLAQDRRRNAADADDGSAAARLSERFLAAIPLHAGAVVSAYHPVREEMDILPLLGCLAARGFATALPVVLAPARPLRFRLWRPGDPLQPARFDLQEPPSGAAAAVPDILCVPMLAFDRAGVRLGYGGGFYDRTLAELRVKAQALAVGVAYAAQEVAEVPRGPHDVPVDWIVTEREAIRIGAESRNG